MNGVNWKIILLSAAGVAWLWFGLGDRAELRPGEEIAKIKGLTTLDEQVRWYEELIARVGPEDAQEQLYRSGLPFTGQTHLLNHAVGDVLYEQYGAAGLPKCKEYFLASCYHGFILQAIAAGGMEEVKKVMATCEQEGRPVHVQCAHAVGHGFLTSVGYRYLLEGLKLCDEASQKIPDFPLYNCHDGVFMENIWGVHEGERSPDAWLKSDDVVYPCNEPRIPEHYLKACWSNQPAYIYQQTGDLKTVGEICLTIANAINQETCFNGLARQIHPLAAGGVDKTFQLCGLMPAAWRNYCVVTNAVSGFSVGDREVPYELCQGIASSAKPHCYGELFGSMKVYAKTEFERREFCGQILEPQWQNHCLVL